MEYYIVQEDSIYKLAEKVNTMIKQGWSPQGGISSTQNSYGCEDKFQQAIIKVDKNETR